MTRRLPFCACMMLALATSIGGGRVSADTGPPATQPALVLLVRHAEKVTKPASADPPLTDAGAQRAQDLARALRDAGVTTIVTTQLRRTRDTAQPLATALRVTPEVVEVDDDTEGHAKAVATAVRKHAGEVVLVVGHSDTVPMIIAALGGPQMPEICETQFANLFVLEPAADGARLVRSLYGAADPPTAPGCGE